jgi:hypothetical protein
VAVPAVPLSSHRPSQAGASVPVVLSSTSTMRSTLFSQPSASSVLSLGALALLAASARADTVLDCGAPLTLAGGKGPYNLTLLGGPHVASRTRQAPPTTWLETLAFDLCADVPRNASLPEEEKVRLFQSARPRRVGLTKMCSARRGHAPALRAQRPRRARVIV